MNKKNNVLFLVLLILLITGCSSAPDNYIYEKEVFLSGAGDRAFKAPKKIIHAANGNFLVANSGDNSILLIDENGKLLNTIGRGGEGAFEFKNLSGIAFNQITEEIWACDLSDNKLIRFDENGNPTAKVTEKINRPSDIAIGKDHSVYVVQNSSKSVLVLDPEGRYLDSIGGDEDTSLELPTSILYHNDNLFITDYTGQKVLQIDIDGNLINEFTDKGKYEKLVSPFGVYPTDEESLIIFDIGYYPLVEITFEGTLISRISDFGNLPGQYKSPVGGLIKDNKLYVLDSAKNSIICYTKK